MSAYPDLKVTKEITSKCRVLTGQGIGCGNCPIMDACKKAIMDACKKDIENYKKYRLMRDGNNSI